MKIRKVRNEIMLPKQAKIGDAGFDLFLPESFDISPFETKTIGLGLGIQVPEGFAGMLVPRSSVAQKGLVIQTSIIDPGYTGEIHLIVTNCSNEYFKFEQGERLCSLVIYSVLMPKFELVEEFEKTQRGNTGLGSSGK